MNDNRDLIARGHELRMDSEKGTPVERIRMLGTFANTLQSSDNLLRGILALHTEGEPMQLHSGSYRTCAQCKGTWPCPTVRLIIGPDGEIPRGTGL